MKLHAQPVGSAKPILAHLSLEDIAKESGISTAAIYKALGEKGNPTIDTLASILKTMGFKLTLTPIDKAS